MCCSDLMIMLQCSDFVLQRLMECVAVIQGVSCSDLRFTKEVRGCSTMQSA